MNLPTITPPPATFKEKFEAKLSEYEQQNQSLLSEAKASQDHTTIKLEDDEENDNAPFAVVVQHDVELRSAWSCAGSLVSVRSALTSRWCARGRRLWVLAATLLSAPPAPPRKESLRRVSRVVFANELGGLLPGEMDDASDTVVDDAWSGASLDIALLEMKNPFGIRSNVRAILMATASSDCGVPGVCHVAGVRPRGPAVLLRIVDLAMARADVCADVARHWAAVRDYVVCLSGNELCPSDRGAGVVCNGKLCGVVSRSARAGGGAAPGCGDVHVAQSLPRWRRFVQCAHTAGSCTRDTECTEICMERQLLPGVVSPDEQSSQAPATTQSAPEPAAAAVTTDDTSATSSEAELTRINTETPASEHTTRGTRRKEKERGHSSVTPARSDELQPTRSAPPPPPPAPLTPAVAAPILHPRIEFDPSRADFKAGEYGDNAADYAGLGEEGGAGVTRPRASSRAPPATTPRPPAPSSPPTTSPRPTRSRLPKTTRFIPPTIENQAAAAEFFPVSPVDVPSFQHDFTLKEDEIHELKEYIPEPKETKDIINKDDEPMPTSTCTKRPNILYSTFCFIPWLVLINMIY